MRRAECILYILYVLYLLGRVWFAPDFWHQQRVTLEVVNCTRSNPHGLVWRSALFTSLINQPRSLEVGCALENIKSHWKPVWFMFNSSLLRLYTQKWALWSTGRTVRAFSGPLFLMVVGCSFLVGLFRIRFLDSAFTFRSSAHLRC